MIINYQGGTVGYLDITFGPKWDYIPLTRGYVENFLLVNMTDKQDIHKIEIAASELLENAVKYSDQDGIRMIVNKQEDKKEITLSVFNHINPEKVPVVMERIKEMNDADPFEYYIERMKKSIKNKQQSAGLGLARINYEGGAKISAVFHENEKIIEVIAVFNLDR